MMREQKETSFYVNSTIRFASTFRDFNDAILSINISLMHHFLKKPFPARGSGAMSGALPPDGLCKMRPRFFPI